MTDNKKAAPVWQLEAASKTFNNCYFTPILRIMVTAVYRLTPWLFLLGVLHGYLPMPG